MVVGSHICGKSSFFKITNTSEVTVVTTGGEGETFREGSNYI